MRACALLLTLVACASSDTPSCPEPVAPSVAPGEGNVLVVILDDVGVEQLGPWGIGPIAAATPTIDCLCDRGVRFTQAYSAPKCTPTRAELLTGVHARRHGLGNHIQTDPYEVYELPPSESSLPSVATAAGRRTGFFGKWHVATPLHDGAATHPNRFGFARYAGSLANLNTFEAGDQSGIGYSVWEKVTDGERALTEVYPTTATVDDALAFLGTVGDDPWLVVLSFNAPHIPLHRPPAPLVHASVDGFSRVHTTYLSMLHALDTELGRFFASLDPQVLADTTVVLLSDNGTVTEHIPPALGLEGKGTVHEGGVRVPLVVAGLGVPAPGVSDALVHTTDLVPTVAELFGQPVPEGLDGRSLVPALADPSAEVHETVHAAGFLNHFEPALKLVAMVRNRTHKLKRDLDGREHLHAVHPHTLDEGPDLLEGPLPPDEQAQLHALRAELDAWNEAAEGP